jgi:hypothetical protein
VSSTFIAEFISEIVGEANSMYPRIITLITGILELVEPPWEVSWYLTQAVV